MDFIQKIYCEICGKYLFTEIEGHNKYRRINDNENYTYNEITGQFICNHCLKEERE